MNAPNNIFKPGDWIVHIFYGIGKVAGEEKRTLEGKELSYLKVNTDESCYWIPVENIDVNRVRLVASKQQFRYALSLIKKRPKDFSTDYQSRRREIFSALQNVSLYAKARLIRDLRNKQMKKSFNLNEKSILENITKQFLQEFALALDADKSFVTEQLNNALATSIQKIALEKRNG